MIYSQHPEAIRARSRRDRDPEAHRAANLKYVLTHPIPHGTRLGYTNFKCRCDSCRDAHNIWQADYRASQPYTGWSRRRITGQGFRNTGPDVTPEMI